MWEMWEKLESVTPQSSSASGLEGPRPEASRARLEVRTDCPGLRQVLSVSKDEDATMLLGKDPTASGAALSIALHSSSPLIMEGWDCVHG